MEKASAPPTLYLTFGLPGSGKTFFARQFAQSTKIPLIETDRLRGELFDEPRYNNSEDNVVASLSDYMAEQFLAAGLSVVIDGLNETRARRHSLRELARKYNAKVVIVWLQTDVHTAFSRASQRDRRNHNDKYAREFSSEEFEAQSARSKPPKHEDYVVISGKHVFRNQMNVVLRKLLAINDSTPATVTPKQVKLGGRVDLRRRNIRS